MSAGNRACNVTKGGEMDLHLNPAPFVQHDEHPAGNLAARRRQPALDYVDLRDRVRILKTTSCNGHHEQRRIWNLLSYLRAPRHLMHPQARVTNSEATARPHGFLSALLLALVFLLILPPALPSAAQEAAPLEVASGPLSERTMVLVGRTVQTPDQLQLFGYVSQTSGLTSQDVFADGTNQVGNARLTFSADVTLQPASNRADTTSYAGEGRLSVYLAADGGASWSDPATFSAGELLAEYDLALRETLQRQAPQVGVLVGDGALTQSTANSFALGENTYRFGAEGLVQRLRYTGALTPDTASSTLAAVVNGHVDVTNREVTVVRLGQPGAPAATPGATAAVAETPVATSACVLEPWLGNATSALALADQGMSGLDLSTIGGVDGTAVQSLAEQIDAAIATLRGTASPSEATDANRLLVTALSTTSRGLRGIAEAVANGDEATFSQATAALGDGQTLLSQAQGEISELAVTCPAG
jgi:hypothetical protein